METFVSELLETADLRIITKKDVRVKYKNFIGRNISADEKARINDLVYAFVSYYAAKQKKLSDTKPGSGGSSPGDKENKQKHVKEKGVKDGQKNGTSKSPLLSGSDKNNQKRAPRKNRPTEKVYMDKTHYHVPEKTKRKVYPERTGKESRRMKITEVVSAIMDTTNSDSSWSTDSDSDISYTDEESEVELNEKEKEQLQMDVKKLQQAREVRIKLAKDRKQKKKSALAKIDINGQDMGTSSKVKKMKKENDDKKQSTYDSDEDSLLLLSDTDSDDLPLTVIRDKSSNLQSDSHMKSTLKNKTEGQKHIKTEPFSQKQSSEKIKKKKVSLKSNFDSSQSDDSVKLNKTPGSYVKTQKLIKSSSKKDKVTDKKSELKRNIVIETDTESEANRPIKKKPKLNTVKREGKDQKKSTDTSGMKSKLSNISKAIKVKKKKESDYVDKKISVLSKDIIKKKKTASMDKKSKYFKVLKDKKGKKVLDSVDIKKLVKKKRDEATLKRLKEKYKEKSQIKGKKSDGKLNNTKVLNRMNSSKTLSRDEIKELVKKKREAAALKKTKKERTGVNKEEAIEITSESQNGDTSETNSEISDTLSSIKRKMNKSVKVTSCDSDSLPDLDSSNGAYLKDNRTTDSDQENIHSELTASSLTESPIKATHAQLKKNKNRQKDLESDVDSLQNGPSSKKSKLDHQMDNTISDSCDKLNKNGLCVETEDSSSEEDVPLSHIKARLACQNAPSEPTESPHLTELRQICAASGIDIVDDRDLRRCSTNGAKIKALRFILREAGMKGLPNMKKAEELKLKREEAAKDTSHILLTETGRARRQVKSIYARLMKPTSNTDTSETSDNDASCLSETEGNDNTDKDKVDESVDNSSVDDDVDAPEPEEPKEMNLFERLKSLGDSESSD